MDSSTSVKGEAAWSPFGLSMDSSEEKQDSTFLIKGL